MTKIITIKNLVIQFDGTGENPVAEAQEAIDLINLALQRDPHGLGAQIMAGGLDASDIEMDENPEEEN